MFSKRISLICIAKANNPTEAIRIRLLLDRARIPYRVTNELLHSVYGLSGATLFGPMEFMIAEDLRHEAETVLEELFDVHQEDIPEFCPACNTPSQPSLLDCPACGLYLG